MSGSAATPRHSSALPLQWCSRAADGLVLPTLHKDVMHTYSWHGTRCRGESAELLGCDLRTRSCCRLTLDLGRLE